MRKAVLLVSLLLFAFLLSLPTLAQTQSSAYIRVAHFALNVGDADVYLNGALRSFGREREFGSVSNWLVVNAGEVEIAVTPSGRSLSTAIVDPTVLTVAPNSRTTIMVIGDARGNGIQPLVFEESSDELASVSARLTIVHAHPTAGVVDLLNDGELFLGRLAYPGTLTLANGGSNDGVVSTDVVAGTYDLAVVPNGLTTPVVIDLTNTTVEAGMHYLVVATVDADGNPTVSVTPYTND